MNRQVSALALTVLVVAGLSACSSSAPRPGLSSVHRTSAGTTTSPAGSSVSGPTSTAPASLAAPASAALTADQLRAVVLKASDLPAGWTAAAFKADPKAAAENAAQAACVGVRNTDSDKVADVHSSSFSLGGESVDSEATSYRAVSDLALERTALKSPKWAPCSQSVLTRFLPGVLAAGITLVSVSVKAMSTRAASGIVGSSDATVVVSRNGARVTDYQRSVFIQGRRASAQLNVTNLGRTPPRSQLQTLAAVLLTRLGGRTG